MMKMIEIVKSKQEICSALQQVANDYLERYKKPKKFLLFGIHTNQPKAQQLIADIASFEGHEKKSALEIMKLTYEYIVTNLKKGGELTKALEKVLYDSFSEDSKQEAEKIAESQLSEERSAITLGGGYPDISGIDKKYKETRLHIQILFDEIDKKNEMTADDGIALDVFSS